MLKLHEPPDAAMHLLSEQPSASSASAREMIRTFEAPGFEADELRDAVDDIGELRDDYHELEAHESGEDTDEY